MGTKVQYKNYIPGYYSTRDLNEDATQNWPLYYEDIVASGQLYGSYTPRLVNGYMDYDKEALKQTMLNHEAIFRKQVHELHRLYKKQRELMGELKQKEHFFYALQSQSSLMSSSSLPAFTKSKEKMLLVPHLWDINCNNISHSSSDREIPEPLNLNNESRQVSAILTESGDSLKKSKLDSKLNNEKAMIDLRLPADVYIEYEKDKTDEPRGAFPLLCVSESPDLNSDLEPGKDLRLTLGSSAICNQGESLLRALGLQNAERLRNFSDLNDPIPMYEISHGVSPKPSSRYQRGEVPYKETNDNKSPLHLNSPLSNVNNLQECKAASSPLLEQKSSVNDSAFAGRSSTGISNPDLSIQNIPEPQRSQLSYFEKPREAGFEEKLSGSNDLLGASLGTNYSAQQTPYSFISLSSGIGIPSSLDSFKVKLIQGDTPFAPIDVDALPPVKKPIPQNQGRASGKSIFASGCASDNFLFGRSFTFDRSFSSEASTYSNSFLDDQNYLSCLNTPRAFSNKASHYFQEARNNCGASSAQDDSSVHAPRESIAVLGDKEVSPLKTVDLNLDLSADCLDEFPSQSETVPLDRQIGNPNSYRGESTWFKLSPFSKQPERNIDNLAAPMNISTPDFSTEPRYLFSSDAAWSVVRNFKPAVCSSSKGFHRGDAIQQSGLSQPNSCEIDIIDLEKCAPAELSSEDGLKDDVCRQMNRINLNFMPCDAPSYDFEINLEVPAIPDIDDAFFCKETIEPDHLFVPAEVLKCGIGAKEETKRPQDCANRAAEIIVAMSTDACKKLDYPDKCMLDATSAKVLVWFAGVICSNENNLRNMCSISNEGLVNEDVDPDGVDFFESMTLKLVGVKPEDPGMKQPPQKDRDSGEAGFASLLVARPKRGQARKRRQKRDFQKDILPGLAILSRKEATEDIQTIGGLMRASGQTWEIGLSRKNASRGGRRARGGSSAATKIKTSPTPAPTPNNTELAIKGTHMVGWGRTRRCRRARFASGNVVPLLPRE